MGGRTVVRRIEPRRILAPLDQNRAEGGVATARAVPRGNRAGRHVARGMRAIRIRRVSRQIVNRRRVAHRNGNLDQNGAKGGVARAAAVPHQDEAQRLLEANGEPFPPLPNRDYYHQLVPCFYRVSHVPLHHVENDILRQRCCQLIAIFSVQYSRAIQNINPFNVRGMNALVGGRLLLEGTTWLNESGIDLNFLRSTSFFMCYEIASKRRALFMAASRLGLRPGMLELFAFFSSLMLDRRGSYAFNIGNFGNVITCAQWSYWKQSKGTDDPNFKNLVRIRTYYGINR